MSRQEGTGWTSLMLVELWLFLASPLSLWNQQEHLLVASAQFPSSEPQCHLGNGDNGNTFSPTGLF